MTRAAPDLVHAPTVHATTMRGRIIEAAIETTSRDGWSAVTMGGLAEQVGVSRQTVYNEVGSKPALAEAVVAHELEGFLSLVGMAFDVHHDDPVADAEPADSSPEPTRPAQQIRRAIRPMSFRDSDEGQNRLIWDRLQRGVAIPAMPPVARNDA